MADGVAEEICAVQALIEAGRSVTLNPGGIYEQVMTDEAQEAAYCQRGLGFIRLAIKHGLPILPTYSFGENQMFRCYKFGLQARLAFAAKFWVALPLFTGRWGLPWLVPHANHVVFVTGKPVEVGEAREPEEKEVLAVFELWKREMERMFEANKHLLPPEVAKNGLLVVHRAALSKSKLP
eukprot:TRINITY_DN19048_c0_g1_i2.p1 TRINITY_DN19048_c0_g1~~TRINITY_DN19048_c0_g1_i2.p1  ORF type:complete len:180 (-),score=35.39 TRINITY_DN19048_c0_g1_i2:136-675(-)